MEGRDADEAAQRNLSNVDELGPVPLIVKRPGSPRGRASGALARTLDVTPTIADVLNVPLGYTADGRSAFSRAVGARRTVSIVKRDFSSVVRLSGARWAARRAAIVRRRLRELGSGDWPSLFTAYGPHRELIGRRVAGRNARLRTSRPRYRSRPRTRTSAEPAASSPRRSRAGSKAPARGASVTSRWP